MTHGAGRAGGFGKRGRVEVSQTEPVETPQAPAGNMNAVKWIGGGLAAVAVMGLLAGGTGGGGLLGGLLGGMLGKHLADRSAARSTTAAAPAAAAHNSSVSRGGFGSTGASSGFSSGS